jgi:hypothetical protein
MKLRNRGLTKEEIADSASTTSSNLSSTRSPAPGQADVGSLSKEKLLNQQPSLDLGGGSFNYCQQPAGDTGAISEDATSNSGMSYTDTSHLSSSESRDNADLGQPSLGSARHDVGACKPCLFVHTEAGCQKGALCDFCHQPHKRKSKPRPCKGKRDRYRRLLQRMGNGENEATVCATDCDSENDHSGELSEQPQDVVG